MKTTLKPLSQQIAESDFSKKEIRILAKKGISVIGKFLAPDEGGCFSTGDVVYQINDNGYGKVVPYRNVLELAFYYN